MAVCASLSGTLGRRSQGSLSPIHVRMGWISLARGNEEERSPEHPFPILPGVSQLCRREMAHHSPVVRPSLTRARLPLELEASDLASLSLSVLACEVDVMIPVSQSC